MTGFNHGVTGALIAVAIKQPLLAIPLSFASHFVCDALPHFGLKKAQLFGKLFNTILVSDFLVALALMWLFKSWFPHDYWRVWLCMIAAASPDLMWAYYDLYLKKIKAKAHITYDFLARFHSRIQWSQTLPGIAVELLWFWSIMGILTTWR